jgi:hypothetical protein
MSDGSHVLVDQAAQARFPADMVSVEVPCREAGRLVFSVGDALADGLVRAGGVVVLLILVPPEYSIGRLNCRYWQPAWRCDGWLAGCP